MTTRRRKLRLPSLRRRRATNPEARMSVLDHLRELRRRVIIALIVVSLGAIVGWELYVPVLKFLEHPYCAVPPKYRFEDASGRCALYYHGVLDGFVTRLKVSFIVGAVFTAPVWLYQIWAFITPGLHANERRYTLTFIVASTVLFAAGVVLAYLVLARGLPILISQSGQGTQSQLTVNDYLAFVTMMLLAFGIAFELPLIVVLANLAGVLPSRLLRKSRRIAIFLIFLFAAVATPTTDPFTMCAMAVPMVLLFEAAIAIARVNDKRRARRRAEAAAQEHLDDDVASTIDPIPRAMPGTGDGWLETT